MMKSSTILLVACFIACSLAQIINPSAAALAASDNVALNYALTLENLEAAFYVQYQARFSAADFATAGYPSYVYTYFGLISAHETSHVTTLRSVLTQRGATPVAACTYNFGNITTVAQYIGVAKILENVGVGAYDGSINRIYDTGLQTAAATIATVEARHAAFLNLLTGDSPFPANVDNATTPTTVAGLITPFLVSCPGGAPILPNVSVVIPVAAPAGQPANPTQAQLNDNDINALNYALTLEHLEATFYNQYQTTYNAAAFLAAGYSAGIYAYFEVIRGHENAHVAALTTTIQNAGRTPVVACTYNFGVTSVATYVATARLLENVGVTAYDGAVNTIFNGDLKVYAATIATVEARHAAFLNNLTGISPFPTATDNATLPIDIVGIITPLLNSCPTPLTAASLPVVRVVLPYNNGTTGATTTGTTSGSTTSRVTSTTSGSSSIVSAVSLSSAVLAAVVGLMAL